MKKIYIISIKCGYCIKETRYLEFLKSNYILKNPTTVRTGGTNGYQTSKNNEIIEGMFKLMSFISINIHVYTINNEMH